MGSTNITIEDIKKIFQDIKYPQWKEIYSASRKTLESFKIPNRLEQDKLKINLWTLKTVPGGTI